MRGRWWQYVAAVGMCAFGVAGFVSRGGLVLRDPDTRSCRVYGISNGLFFASTYGSDSPRGWSTGVAGRGAWQWWPRGGFFGSTPTIDPNAPYGTDWALCVPLWIPFGVCAAVLAPRLRPWWAVRMHGLERRIEIGARLKRAKLLRAGCCAACGYDISTLRRARTACPECGVAAASGPTARRR